MKRFIPLAILATFILVAFIMLTGEGFSLKHSSTSENRGSSSIQEQESVKSGKSNSSRTRERIKTGDPHLQLIKLSSAKAAIVRSLEDDEASRSKLIEEKETPDSYIYRFEIERNAGLDDLVSRLCVEASTQKDINLSALKRAVDDSIGDFKIPEGYLQEIWIKVPKDSRSETTYAMMPMSRALGPGRGEGKLTTTAGTVPPAQRGWRYEKLLELHPKEQSDVPGSGVEPK